jgi:hypothetical protein
MMLSLRLSWFLQQKPLVAAIGLFLQCSVWAQTCVPQNEFVPLDPALVGLDDLQNVALGGYERISPDGRFVLRSFSGKQLSTVSLIELPPPASGKPHKVWQTPLTNEAFPVQGTWRYLIEIDGSHYTFASVLHQQTKAKPLFRAGMTGFYATAAELNTIYPARSAEPVQIRSLSWPNANARGDMQGQGTLTSTTYTVDPLTQKVLDDTGTINLCTERVGLDGAMYALPMLSVNGQEFSALAQKPSVGNSNMRVFDFGPQGRSCIARLQLKGPSSKLTFGYSQDGKPGADFVYEHGGQVWWYSRNLGQAFNMAPWEDEGKAPVRDIMANAFPGMSRDGRVIYAANWKRCNGKQCRNEGGYVLTDPYQSYAYLQFILEMQQKGAKVAPRACITVEQVKKERDDFARFHGL